MEEVSLLFEHHISARDSVHWKPDNVTVELKRMVMAEEEAEGGYAAGLERKDPAGAEMV